MKVSVSEAQDRIEELLDRIAVGEEVVITDHGEPVAKLVPIPTLEKNRSRIRLGSAKGEFTVPDDFNGRRKSKTSSDDRSPARTPSCHLPKAHRSTAPASHLIADTLPVARGDAPGD